MDTHPNPSLGRMETGARSMKGRPLVTYELCPRGATGALGEEFDSAIANLAMTLTTVSHKERHQFRQGGEDGVVNYGSAVPAAGDQACRLQLAEMEGNPRSRRIAQSFCDFPR